MVQLSESWGNKDPEEAAGWVLESKVLLWCTATKTKSEI